MNEKTRILFLGDTLSGTIPSGLGGVLMSFMKRMNPEKYEVAYANMIGADCTIEDLKYQGKDVLEKFYPKLPMFNCQITDQAASVRFNDIIKQFRPEIVISIGDLWCFDAVAFSAHRANYMWVAYITVESPGYPEQVMFPTSICPYPRKSLKETMSKCDLIIPVTDLGTEYMTRLDLKDLLSKTNIFNGLDTNLRVTRSSVSKKDAFRGGIREDDFVFMTMGKNSPRKKIEMAILAFNDFLIRLKKQKQNTDKFKLYVHSNVNDYSCRGTDLGALVSGLGLLQSVIFPQELMNNQPFDKSLMYARYACSDCYLALSGAEGFNYGVAEAMLMGIPVIYTNWGGHTTYVQNGAAYAVETKAYVYANNFAHTYALANTEDAAAKMQIVYEQRKALVKKCEEGTNWVMNNLDWDKNIFPQFINTVEEKYNLWKESKQLNLFKTRVV